MRSETAEIVFVFPPAYGNAGAFKTHLGSAYLRTALATQGIVTTQYQNESPDTVAAVVADILGYRPRIVGFTVYDANFPLSLALARDLKRQQPDVQIVFGGPTATFGATPLFELAKELEFMAREGRLGEVGGRIEILEETFNRAAGALEKLCA